MDIQRHVYLPTHFKKSRKYICSPYYGYTEVVDSEGKQVKKGCLGEIVVTSFYNRAMPLIRYRTGDMGIYGGVKDGVVYLDKIEGRTQDYIYNNDGIKIPLTALVFGQHYKAFVNIRKWQIIQYTKGRVIVKIIKSDKYTLKDQKEIKQKFDKLANTKVVFKYVNKIDLTKRGKYRFLLQHMRG